MSLTINTNGLKFVIFASGHDYTLADSGDGDVQIFSHPFVPLNSVNYAGQYYFIVPDENGDPLDAVKDDIAHCTFTPALGTAFDTEGATVVSVNYHREYIHDEETIVVDKTVSQTIQVVDHGAVVDQTTNLDVYSDGYGFIRPQNVNVVEVKDYTITQKNAVTKVSSFPWRATGLGAGKIYHFFTSTNLTDISEWAYADVSKCTHIHLLFAGDRSLSDISAVADWDTSNVTELYDLVEYSNITSLKALEKWNTSKVTSLEMAFAVYMGTSLEGLEHWDTSNVTNMKQFVQGAEYLTDVSALSAWNMSKVTTLYYAFNNTRISNTNAFALWHVPALKNIEGIFKICDRLVDLSGLSNWVAEITEIKNAFEGCTAMSDVSGVHGLDVHLVTNFSSVFEGCWKLLNLDGLEEWDVSNGTNFYRMFRGCPWLSDLSGISDWDMSNASNLAEMFNACNSILLLDDLANWRLNTQALSGLFMANYLCYSTLLGKWLLETTYYYFDYAGNQYAVTGVYDGTHPLQYPTYDADKASLWGVSGSNLNAFDNKWVNVPAWN